MMFVSSIRMKAQPGKRKEILQTINGIIDQLSLKKGCLDVSSYQDIDDENIFYVVEEWQTEQDLNEYLHSKLFAVLLGIKTILVDRPEIKILSEKCCYNCEEKEKIQVQ